MFQKKEIDSAVHLLNASDGSMSKSNEIASVVSFFSGCGGLDLGFKGNFKYRTQKYRQQLFDILKSYDNDLKCVDTYRENISDKVEQKDLGNFKPEDIPQADVLIGGFPCQDFASCGPRKGLESERGKLYRALVKYMKFHQPAVVVAENVPGLANHNGGKTLEKIVTDFEKQGYRFEVWTLYGPDYGVPQTRTRLFIIGVKEELDGFPRKPRKVYDKDTYRSVEWAIGDLESILDDDLIQNQSQFFRASKAKNGNGQGDETSIASKPAYTVRANAKSRVQFHYSQNRRLTVRECARIQTFPDDFIFPHSATSNIMQIGNAVPPILAYKVAKSVSKYLQKINYFK